MRYEIINERKKILGITNAQLADMTGVTLSTLDKITSGANQNPKLGTLQAIAKAIGCTLDDFDDEIQCSFSPEALEIARKFDSLDAHSRKVVEAVVDLESRRDYAAEVERFNSLSDSEEALDPIIVSTSSKKLG